MVRNRSSRHLMRNTCSWFLALTVLLIVGVCAFESSEENPFDAQISVLMLGTTDGKTLVVQKRYEIVNSATTTFDLSDRPIEIYLPSDIVGSASCTLSHGDQKTAITLKPPSAASAASLEYPLPPGKTTIDVRYQLPFNFEEHLFKEVLLYPTKSFPVFTFPPSLELVSDQVHFVSKDERMNRYHVHDDLQANQALLMVLRMGAVQEHTHGDAGGGVVMESPNRLQKYQGPIVGVLTLVLILGSIALFRDRKPLPPAQPQTTKQQSQIRILEESLTNIDSQYKAGLINDKTYKARRREVRQQLRQIQSNSEGTS